GAGTPSPAAGMFDDLPDAKPMSWMDYANGVAEKAAQGITFKYGDEIAALMGSGFGLGKKIGLRDRQEILDEIHQKEHDFEKRYPKTALGAEIAGSLGTGFGAGRWALAAPGWISRAFRAGTAAAPMAALAETGGMEGEHSLADYGEAAA